MHRAPTDRLSESAEGVLAIEPVSLVAGMRARTRMLHTLAERSGYISQMLQGRGSLDGYLMLLRNLLPAYEELERGVERHRGTAVFAGVPWASLYRAPSIERDLGRIGGVDWRASIALLPSGQNYAEQVAHAAAGNGEKLLAHAYARYLGDLSGGQVIKRLLGKSLGLSDEALSFYEFPAIDDVAGFKSAFRTAVDAAAANILDVGSVVEEAAIAFQLNIELSNEIQSAS
jgi:heme oxygenase (biliverdin-producing, ferredoxin)